VQGEAADVEDGVDYGSKDVDDGKELPFSAL